MDLKEQTRQGLEKRVKKIENFIETKGVGSTYLDKVRKTQRNVNLALAAASIVTILGVAVWVMNISKSDE